MRTLYLDCFSGISGDMVLGAFLDLGVEEAYLKSELAKLHLSNYEISAEKTKKQGISGTICRVKVKEEHVHRNLADICAIIEQSDLDTPVKKTATAIFTRVAKAEAKVHGVSVETVHFHEVGALDSIIDIVGAAICFHRMNVERVLISGINTGSGWVDCAHGRLPVPVPAVVEILAHTDIPLYARYIEEEAATPTGVAIAAQLARYVPSLPAMTLEKAAYGFGTKEFPVLNGLRLMLGETTDCGHRQEHAHHGHEVTVLETNIDDGTGEMAGYVMEKLLAEGARDVFYTPVYMKKNRPAMLLTVLANPGDAQHLEEIIMGETTTLGVRRHLAKRSCMNRSMRTLETPYGPVRVKVCDYGTIHKETLEYDDVSCIAKKTGKTYLDVVKELTFLL